MFVSCGIRAVLQALRTKAVLVAGTVIGVMNFLLLTVAHAAIWQIIIAMFIQALVRPAFAAMSSLVVAASVRADGRRQRMNANIRTIGGAIGAA